MENLSRRKLLASGGALGALGVVGACTPLKADMPGWNWTTQGSIKDIPKTGINPHDVWDEEADELVRSLIERGKVERVNESLRKWQTNGQDLAPLDLPSDVRDFIERARQLPAWADHDKLVTAFEFNRKRGLYLGVTYGFASGMMSTVIPREARAVYYSRGGADMRDRITKTAKLGYDQGSHNAFRPDGAQIVTTTKVRLTHAGVRNLLPASIKWDEVSDETIPISQWDMMVTWHSLPTTVMQNLHKWGIPIDPAESEAFLHSWQLTGHMLGIKDELLPTSWDEANAQAGEYVKLGITPEGYDLAHQLLNLGSFIDKGILTPHILGALTRYVLGDEIAGWLDIPREPFWDGVLNNLWIPFIRVREGLLEMKNAPKGLEDVYWAFDEVLRLGALTVLSGAKFPLDITIPTRNNPEYPDDASKYGEGY
ncbi:MAG: DUF2236 domain-containing protein [Actinobacteria bacterium]|nr:DUF2236 domain-containing protein [Actinomycetota bacterium]MCB9390108.1 DUF2236 domain-containing protein [Acidimicrobiia bacterium]